MVACRPRPLEAPAASLLPPGYDSESVAASFNAALHRLAGEGDLGYKEGA
jgi:hypothetical protein